MSRSDGNSSDNDSNVTPEAYLEDVACLFADDTEASAGFAALRAQQNTAHTSTYPTEDPTLWDCKEKVAVRDLESSTTQQTVTHIQHLAEEERALTEELNSLRKEEHALLQHHSKVEVLRYTDSIDDAKYRLQAQTRSQELSGRDSITRYWQKKEEDLIDSLSAKASARLLKTENPTKAWSVEWEKAPQCFSVTLHCAKGVKDKLMQGVYVMHMEVAETLGGRSVSFLGSEDSAANSTPTSHFGKYYTMDMTFVDEELTLVCPAHTTLRSHVVLRFELWRIKNGRRSPVDVIAAWGAWPLVNEAFLVQPGQFKLPLLAGTPQDKSYDTFSKIHSCINDDLALWAGTLYFTITPQRVAGWNSFDGIKGNKTEAEETRKEEENCEIGDGENEDIEGEKKGEDNHFGPMRVCMQGTPQTADETYAKLAVERIPRVSFYSDLTPSHAPSQGDNLALLRRLLETRGRAHFAHMMKDKHAAWDQLHISATEQEHCEGLNEDVDAGEVDFLHEVLHCRGEAEVRTGDKARRTSLAGMRGMGRLGARHSVVKKIRRVSLARSQVLSAAEAPTASTPNDLHKHTASLSRRREFTKKRRAFLEKAPFATAVLCFDLGINPTGLWDKPRFIGSMVIFFFMLHVTRYTHSFGLWLYLTSRDIIFTVLHYYPLVLEYTNDGNSNFTPTAQVLATVSGVLFNFCLQLVVTCTVALVQKLFGFFPYTASRYVFWLSICVLFDPFLTFLFDLVTVNRFAKSEILQLYNMFQRENNIGPLGLVITALVYFKVMIFSGFLLYKFTVRCHLNGRIEDVYKRCMCPESSFVLPHDCEVSPAELDTIVDAARSWRSERGEVKRIVCEEATDTALCLFRDRLWVLLALAQRSSEETSCEKWLQVYLHSIILTRRRIRGVHCKDGLGSHRIASDITKFLERHFPFLMQSNHFDSEGSGAVAMEEADAKQRFLAEHYDAAFMKHCRSRSSSEADLAQQRHLLYRYFHERLRNDNEIPVLPVEDQNSSTNGVTPFSVKNAQILADLIFFETDGSANRLELLGTYLDERVVETAGCVAVLQGFSLNSRFLSCAVHSIQAGFVTIFIEFPGEAAGRKVHRSFVYCPTGEVVEAIPSGYTFDPSVHTTDDPEYWIHRLLSKYVAFDELR